MGRQNRRMGRYRNCLRKSRNIVIRVAGDPVIGDLSSAQSIKAGPASTPQLHKNMVQT
jgi:hypothetical protein